MESSKGFGPKRRPKRVPRCQKCITSDLRSEGKWLSSEWRMLRHRSQVKCFWTSFAMPFGRPCSAGHSRRRHCTHYHAPIPFFSVLSQIDRDEILKWFFSLGFSGAIKIFMWFRLQYSCHPPERTTLDIRPHERSNLKGSILFSNLNCSIHEAFRQVDWYFTKVLGFGEGTPPAHRGSCGTDSSELSERICMNPFFSSQKVASMAFDIFWGCWLLQTSRKYQFVAATSPKSPCIGYWALGP